MIIRPKLLILGAARHGKDTVGEWMVRKGYTFVSSSRFVGEKAVLPAIEAAWRDYTVQSVGCDNPECCDPGPVPTIGPYNSFEEAFADRHNHRAFWFNTIAAYNRPDRCRLGRELFAEGYDLYVGLRNYHELEALRLIKAFDLAIWVDASERVAKEDSASISIFPWQADVIIDNNGTLDDLDKQLVVLYDKWIRPLERRSSMSRLTGVCPECNNQARRTPCKACNP